MGIGIWLLITIVIVFLVVYLYEHNLIKSLYNKVLQSKSGIDVALNKRFDLIPNLVECVKGYAVHEKEILQIIMRQRDEYYKTSNLNEAKEVNKYCNQILALREKYPDLKASEQFLSLQDSLSQRIFNCYIYFIIEARREKNFLWIKQILVKFLMKYMQAMEKNYNQYINKF